MSRKKVSFFTSDPFVFLADFDGNWFESSCDGALKGSVVLPSGMFHYEIQQQNIIRSKIPNLKVSPISILTPPDRDEFEEHFIQIQQQLRRGNTYLINYCTATPIHSTLSPLDLYHAADAPYKFWLENSFLCFSPEAFVTIMGNTIITRPMKGTSLDREALLRNEKEKAEHATIVDLLRNDLGQVAKNIRIARYRYITEIPTAAGLLFQTSSEIQGVLPADWRKNIREIIQQLLPAGSVTGAPKKETVRIIRRIETRARGFYTGVAGIFDGENLYSAVLIRYIDLQTQPWTFRSGVGITSDSQVEDEYGEILQKIYFPL